MNMLSYVMSLRSGGLFKVVNGAIDCSAVRVMDDIIRSYPHVGRFGGQCKGSDLDHVVFGLQKMSWNDPLRPYWMLHEADEALGVGDMNFRLTNFSGPVREYKDALFNAIVRHAGLDPLIPEEYKRLKQFDLAVGCYECLKAFGRDRYFDILNFYQEDLPTHFSDDWDRAAKCMLIDVENQIDFVETELKRWGVKNL